MKSKSLLFPLMVLLSLALSGCEGEADIDNEVFDVATLKNGLTTVPSVLNADESATFYYKADPSSELYNCGSDLYFYTGVWYDSSDWRHVQAEWGKNTDKCKMEKVADNVWKLSMEPSVRGWYGSGTTAVWYLGIVIRNAEGNKQTRPDFIVDVTDDLYDFDTFDAAPVVEENMPEGWQYGINYLSATSVGLVLYDRNVDGLRHDYCHVIGDFSGWERDNLYAMKYDDEAGCWWYQFDNLLAGKEYKFQYYLKKGKSKVVTHDPFTEIVYDQWNDGWIPSATYPELPDFPAKASGLVSAFQTERKEYTWEVSDYKIEDKDDLIIYELLLRDFTANGDFEGNLANAAGKLDYLQTLGVNAIELMPVQEFDGNNSWGYNPNSFFALDKAYGTREDYKKFIDECHKRGMAVFFDVVYNHATGSCALAKMYWNGSATASDNPWFNVKAKHPYNVYHDINHESEFVRSFVKRNLKYLLEEYNIDGFRFDLTKGFTQNNTYGNETAWSRLDQSRVTILKDYADAVWEQDPDVVVIFEHLADNSEEKILAEHGIKLWRKMCDSYGQTAMGYSSNSSFSGLYTGTSMPFGSLVGYMESHDEERLSYKQTQWGVAGVKGNMEMRMKRLALNAAFFFTVPGPKMIWQFGELGYDYSINYPSGKEDDRTGKKPVKWEYLDDEHRQMLYDTYCSLIAFRKAYPSFFDRDATFSWKVSVSDWKMRYIHCVDADGKAFAVVGNFSTENADVTLPLPSEGTWRSFDGKSVYDNVSEITLTLSPADYVLLVNF